MLYADPNLYHGSAHWMMPGGFDVSVVRLPAGPSVDHSSARVVAILGYEGQPIWRALLDKHVEELEEHERPSDVAALALVVQQDRGSRGVKWPGVLPNGDLSTDRRHRGYFGAQIDIRDLERDTLWPFAAETQLDVGRNLSDSLNALLRLYRPHNPEELAAGHSFARFGVPLTAYDEPEAEDVAWVEGRAQHLLHAQLDSGTKFSVQGAVQDEIEAARGAGSRARSRLAAWRHLHERGIRVYWESFAFFYERALADLQANLPSAPQEIAEAWRVSSAVHQLLYAPSPHFDYELFQWRVPQRGVLNLQCPRLFDAARDLWGREWLFELIGATAAGDVERHTRMLADYHGLVALVGSYRIAKGAARRIRRKPTDDIDQAPQNSLQAGAGAGGVFATVDSNPDPLANVLRSERAERIQAEMAQALAGRKAQEIIIRRCVMGKEPQTVVARDLGISEGRVSQIKNDALKVLRQSPALQELFAESMTP